MAFENEISDTARAVGIGGISLTTILLVGLRLWRRYFSDKNEVEKDRTESFLMDNLRKEIERMQDAMREDRKLWEEEIHGLSERLTIMEHKFRDVQSMALEAYGQLSGVLAKYNNDTILVSIKDKLNFIIKTR